MFLIKSFVVKGEFNLNLNFNLIGIGIILRLGRFNFMINSLFGILYF